MYQDEYSFRVPFQQQAYNNGVQGYTGGGMISQLDNARIESQLWNNKIQSANNAFQGHTNDPYNAPSWYQLQEMNAAKNRADNIVANHGQTPQMFSRPQFELGSAMANFNELGNLWGGQKQDVNRVIEQNVPGLSRANQGQHMASMAFGLNVPAWQDAGPPPQMQQQRMQPMQPTNNQPLPSMQIRNYGQAPPMSASPVTMGGTVLPFQFANPFDVQQSTPTVLNHSTQAMHGDIAQSDRNLTRQQMNAPIGVRADMMGRDMGVFGYGDGRQYMPMNVRY